MVEIVKKTPSYQLDLPQYSQHLKKTKKPKRHFIKNRQLPFVGEKTDRLIYWLGKLLPGQCRMEISVDVGRPRNLVVYFKDHSNFEEQKLVKSNVLGINGKQITSPKKSLYFSSKFKKNKIIDSDRSLISTVSAKLFEQSSEQRDNLITNHKENITKISFKIIDCQIIEPIGDLPIATQIITEEEDYIPMLRAFTEYKKLSSQSKILSEFRNQNKFVNKLVLTLKKEPKYSFIYIMFHIWKYNDKLELSRVGPVITLKEIKREIITE